MGISPHSIILPDFHVRVQMTKKIQKELLMAEKVEPQETVTVEDALQMEIIVNQAIIDILIEKGIFTEKELMEKIAVLKMNQPIVTA